LLTWTQTHKDLPVQLLLSQSPLEASLIIASQGSAKGSVKPVFDINLKLDVNGPTPAYEKPLRYGSLAEIHHIFRAGPKNPPKIVSLVFSLAVLATVPALLVGVSIQPARSKRYALLTQSVACPWCQCQPHLQGSRQRARLPRRLLRLDRGHGGRLLPLL